MTDLYGLRGRKLYVYGFNTTFAFVPDGDAIVCLRLRHVSLTPIAWHGIAPEVHAPAPIGQNGDMLLWMNSKDEGFSATGQLQGVAALPPWPFMGQEKKRVNLPFSDAKTIHIENGELHLIRRGGLHSTIPLPTASVAWRSEDPNFVEPFQSDAIFIASNTMGLLIESISSAIFIRTKQDDQ